MLFEQYDNCFVCGKENKNGLQLNIEINYGSSHARIEFPHYMQGYTGVVHGGLISTVLDELAVYAGISLGGNYVTGEITVRFKKPVETGYEYIVKGKVIEDRGKVVNVESLIMDSQDVVYAEANVKLMRIND